VFVTLVIQHAKRMRRVILSFVVRPVQIYSSTWSHKRYDFRRKIYWTSKCVVQNFNVSPCIFQFNNR